MWWLNKAAPAEPLAVSMSGVKLGDRLLVLGCRDASLITQLALKTGLTGRACAIDEDAARTARAAEVVAREGALVEAMTAPWTQLPVDAAAFDVIVMRSVLTDLHDVRRAPVFGEVLRVLRPGGRCIVIEGGQRAGLSALFGGRAGDTADAERMLSSAGFRAVRTLAVRGGLTFVEGIKGAQDSPGQKP